MTLPPETIATIVIITALAGGVLTLLLCRPQAHPNKGVEPAHMTDKPHEDMGDGTQ